MTVAIIITDLSELDQLTVPDDVFLEYRIDYDQRLLHAGSNNHPLILTLRSTAEGGGFEGNRTELLQKMIGMQPTYVDLEIDRDYQLVEELSGSIPILSKHDYSQPMVDAAQTFAKQYRQYHHQEDIVVKFVGDPVDVMDLLDAMRCLAKVFPRHIILGINQQGVPSRILPGEFKQEFVFGSKISGIIPHYAELLEAHQRDAIITGLLGKSLDHSLSPQIHRLLLTSTGIKGHYGLYEVQDERRIPDFLAWISTTRIRGLNVTFPYKQSVVPYTDPSDEVAKLGVCNTLLFKDNRIQAFNTDITGFKRFYDSIELTSEIQSVMIFGAGGAARAIVTALLDYGLDITIVNRSQHRLDDLPEFIKERVSTRRLDQVEELNSDCYINATSIGYETQNPTVFLKLPTSVKLVIDLNYTLEMTPLIEEARNKSIEAHDGKAMLFHQAVDAFEIWTNQEINRDEVYQQFLQELIQ